MYVVNNYIVYLLVQGTSEKQLADTVSLVKKPEKIFFIGQFLVAARSVWHFDDKRFSLFLTTQE